MSCKGMLVIISGPSGSGKGTVVKKLTDGKYALSISVTARKMRENETDGVDYFFRSEEEFLRMRDNNELLEYTVYCGNYYGTPRSYVEGQIEAGKAVVLEIDVSGALQVKEKFNDSIMIFLIPPTMEELRRRLILRNTEDIETIESRLNKALDEIKQIDKYDYLVINDEVECALDRINAIVEAEYLRPQRNSDAIRRFI